MKLKIKICLNERFTASVVMVIQETDQSINSDLIRCHCYRRQKVISWDNKSFKVKDDDDDDDDTFIKVSRL